MSLNNAGIYVLFTTPGTPGAGGQTGYEQEYLLNDDGDPVLQGGIDELLNSDGDPVLQSPMTSPEQILNSDGNYLLNSTGQFVLARGYTAEPVLSTGNKVASKG